MIAFFKKYLQGDTAIWVIVLIMALLSMMLVYSTVVGLAYKYNQGHAEYYLLKRFVFIVTGFAFTYLIHKVNYRFFSRLGQLFIWPVIALLVLTLVLGVNLNNASRWLTIPVLNQSFQTSDLAKLVLILFVARSLSLRNKDLTDFSKSILPLMGMILLVIGLILPANLSTSLVLLTTAWMMMFLAGVKIKYLLSIVPVGVAGLLIVISLAKINPEMFPRFETWNKRIERFISDEPSRDGNYQIEQAKIAIATGGVLGKGPGNSTQRNFLPSSYSDFIYAIIVEEYGLFGGIVIIGFYLIVLYRSIVIARKTKSRFAALLVLGLSFSLVFQGLINMGVNVGLLPVTGQTLPLLSKGGTSFWFTSISLGMILSVSRSLQSESEPDRERPVKNRILIKEEDLYAGA